jgi:hypothetical protein
MGKGRKDRKDRKGKKGGKGKKGSVAGRNEFRKIGALVGRDSESPEAWERRKESNGRS